MTDLPDEQFDGFLDTVAAALTDQTPAVQGFVRDLQARHRASRDQGGPGVTTRTLVVDLVGILSFFETRLNELESIERRTK